MPRGIGAHSQRLVVIGARNPTRYGHLRTMVPAGSVLMDLFDQESLFSQGFFKLEGDEEVDELRHLPQEVLDLREVLVTPWAWTYLRLQGYVGKVGPGEGDGPDSEQFPPDLPHVLADCYHQTQLLHPEVHGRILRVSDVMETLKQLQPNYNLRKENHYRRRLTDLLKGYCR